VGHYSAWNSLIPNLRLLKALEISKFAAWEISRNSYQISEKFIEILYIQKTEANLNQTKSYPPFCFVGESKQAPLPLQPVSTHASLFKMCLTQYVCGFVWPSACI
jgi:hypothetical protein